MPDTGCKRFWTRRLTNIESCSTQQSLRSEWRQDGLLYAFETTKGLQDFAATDQLITENYGVSARLIDGQDLPAFDASLKEGLAGAYIYPGDATVRPDVLVRQWRTHLATTGVEFVENCSLEDIRISSGNIECIETSGAEYSADHYVFSTGAWSGKLAASLGCRIPVEPGKGYSVTMCRPDGSPTHSMLFPEHHIGVTPFADSLRIGSMMEFVGFDTSIPQRRIDLLCDSARTYLTTPGRRRD